MKTPRVLLAVFLAILWTAASAEADPRFNGRDGGGRFGAGTSPHAFGSAHTRGQFVHKGFGPHRIAPRRFVPFGVVIAPPIAVYSSTPDFYTSPPYYGSPVYSPAVTVPPTVYSSPAYAPPAPTPPAPPPPRIVEYPTGRYELRGDGIGTPYTWVWIPNPPPAPPAASPSRGEAPTATPAPTRRSQVYRWTDEQGTEFWTNSVEKVPEPYRSGTRGPA
jgi:hypothetical protein